MNEKKKVNLYFLRSNYDLIFANLCQSLLKKHLRLVINTNNIQENKELDNYLWNFKSESFVPHRTIDDEEYNFEKIILFHGDYTKQEKLKNYDIIFFCPSVRVKKFEVFRSFFLFSEFKENFNYKIYKEKLERNGFETKILIEEKNKQWNIF